MQGFIATATLRYRATFANMLGSAPGIVTYNYRVRIADGIAQATVSRDVEAATSLGPGFGIGQPFVLRRNRKTGAIEFRSVPLVVLQRHPHPARHAADRRLQVHGPLHAK